MKRIYFSCAVAAMTLVLTACASLRVDVSILDRRFWSSPTQLGNAVSEQVADLIRKRGDGRIGKAREKLKADAHAALVAMTQTRCLDPTTNNIRGCVSQDDLERLNSGLSNSVDTQFAEADVHFQKAFSLLVTASKENDDIKRVDSLFDAQREVVTGYEIISRVADAVSADLRRALQPATDNLTLPSNAGSVANASRAVADINATVNGLIGDRGILDDPLASSVVYADEQFWRRREAPFGINDTFATGFLGNTDIAIKMESIGDFTIKGVRLDAAKITQATFAVGRQAIKAVAALNGFVLPGDSNPKAGASPPAPFAETPVAISSPDTRRQTAEDALLRRRLARLAIMETILAQRDALTNPATDTGTESARAAAIKVVKDTFAANRADLDQPASKSQ